METIANLSLVLRKQRAGFYLPSPKCCLDQLLANLSPGPDAVRSKNPSNSMLAHDEVAAAVLYKHHSVIREGAGLIQFVYGSHTRFAADLILHKILFPPFFLRASSNLIPLSANIWTVGLTRQIGREPYNINACVNNS